MGINVLHVASSPLLCVIWLWQASYPEEATLTVLRCVCQRVACFLVFPPCPSASRNYISIDMIATGIDVTITLPSYIHITRDHVVYPYLISSISFIFRMYLALLAFPVLGLAAVANIPRVPSRDLSSPLEPRGISPDGSCAGSQGYTCATGNCCSQFGFWCETACRLTIPLLFVPAC